MKIIVGIILCVIFWNIVDNNPFYTFAPPLTDFEVRAYIVLLTGIGAIIWGVIEIVDKDNK